MGPHCVLPKRSLLYNTFHKLSRRLSRWTWTTSNMHRIKNDWNLVLLGLVPLYSHQVNQVLRQIPQLELRTIMVLFKSGILTGSEMWTPPGSQQQISQCNFSHRCSFLCFLTLFHSIAHTGLEPLIFLSQLPIMGLQAGAMAPNYQSPPTSPLAPPPSPLLCYVHMCVSWRTSRVHKGHWDPLELNYSDCEALAWVLGTNP